MRVLIWTQYFWPENFFINTITRSLSELGVEVTVLTGKPNYPEGQILSGYTAAGIHREKCFEIDIIRIPIKARGSGSSIGLALNYLSFILSGYLFAPFALHGKTFDIVFVYAPSPLLQALPAIFTAWLRRIPLVLWVQDIWPDALHSTGFIKNRWVLSLIGLTVRYIYRFSDSILIQSEGFRASVEHLVNDKKKIRFYPNSAEDVLVNPITTRQYTCLDQDIKKSFSVIFAGNIGTAQSCETIIEAATLLQGTHNIKFYLIGNGSMADSINKSIVDNKLNNIVMTGRVAPENMSSIYASASVLLLSLRDDPALAATIPSKLQSYLAAGKPVIVSSNGESANVVLKANAGLTSPAGNSEALAQVVLKLYEMHPEERMKLGENGRKYFLNRYYLPDRVAELLAHFEDVVVCHSQMGKK